MLKDCFEKKNISMLQDAVLKLSKEDAEYHIQRCVDSGLWVPNASEGIDGEKDEGGEKDGEKDSSVDGEKGAEKKEEEIYEEVDDGVLSKDKNN